MRVSRDDKKWLKFKGFEYDEYFPVNKVPETSTSTEMNYPSNNVISADKKLLKIVSSAGGLVVESVQIIET